MTVGVIEKVEMAQSSIGALVLDIKAGRIQLPAFQRKLVWTEDQIVNLFDSIMRGYPIGTFLFWKLDKRLRDGCNISFMEFIRCYSEFDNHANDKARWPRNESSIYAVLDGQQRLAALYIGLMGSLALHRKGGWWTNPDAFPAKLLYVDSKHDWGAGGESDGPGFGFFETEPEPEQGKHWVCVSDMFEHDTWASFKYEDFQNRAPLKQLWDAIWSGKVYYYSITDEDIEDVLDIFIRINSGGTVLTRSDLLFSILAADWPEARENVDNLVKSIKEKGFLFSTDFIIRSALACSNMPISTKVEQFKKDRTAAIRRNWAGVSKAVKETCDLLLEYCYTSSSLSSENAVIPLVYYCFNHGKPKYSADPLIWGELRKYLAVAQINGVFSASVDTTLDRVIRNPRGSNGFRNIGRNFSMRELSQLPISGKRSFRITEEDLDELLELEKDDRHTFAVLSLLYPNTRTDIQDVHKDHMHPCASFTHETLAGLGVDEEKQQDWIARCNMLPNLQLLPGRDNESKNALSLEEWASDSGNRQYLKYIEGVPSLRLQDFDEFMRVRSNNMRAELRRIFDVQN